jgi:hypothetical protein
MSVNQYALVIPANGLIILEPGNFFFLVSSSNPISVIFQTNAGREAFTGITAGLRVQRLKPWANIAIQGVAGTVISAYVGNEIPREDSTDFVQTIATIAGTVLFTPGVGSSNAMTNHADVTVATVTLDTTIPANAARKGLIIGSKSTNAPAAGLSLRIQGGAGVASAQGIELQPGTSYMFQGTFPCSTQAFAIYNPAAVSQVYWWIEQT